LKLKEIEGMLRAIVGAGLVAFSWGAAFGQSSETLPSFEVASIKPAAPMQAGRIMVRMSGGPGTPDPGQMTYTNVSLKNVLTNAYNVKGYQIQGPDWLDSARFDITAKVPLGTTKEQFRLMLQSLLAERFKLTLHHATKDMPMYALVVAKGGSKLKESPDDPPSTDAGGPNAGGPVASGSAVGGPAAGGGPSANFNKGDIKMGKDGFPQLPPGAGRGATMMMNMNGKMKMQSSKQTMSSFVDMLANQLDRPVVDQTDLKGKYDYTLEFAPGDNRGGMMRGAMAGMPMPMPPPGADGGGAGGTAPDAEAGPTIFSALQEQLGLRLEAKKGPVDLLVIDSIEKTPTEN
jgi:uncharacterized protein (TIGR03435 family)